MPSASTISRAASMASATATPSASHDGDPDLANITNVTTSVEVGHVITVPHAYLKKSPVKIEWMQNMQPRSDTYYQVAFTNTNAGKAKYFLFISSDRIEDFRKLDMPQSPEDKIMVTVTTDFQYGQKDQIGKNRFLVYHHSDRCAMKQFRFVAAAWNTYSNMASGFVDIKSGGDMRDVSLTLTREKVLGNTLIKFENR